MKSSVYWYATFNGEPVHFLWDRFESGHFWMGGAAVTHFSDIRLARAFMTDRLRLYTPTQRKRWKLIRVTRRQK